MRFWHAGASFASITSAEMTPSAQTAKIILIAGRIRALSEELCMAFSVHCQLSHGKVRPVRPSRALRLGASIRATLIDTNCTYEISSPLRSFSDLTNTEEIRCPPEPAP